MASADQPPLPGLDAELNRMIATFTDLVKASRIPDEAGDDMLGGRERKVPGELPGFSGTPFWRFAPSRRPVQQGADPCAWLAASYKASGWQAARGLQRCTCGLRDSGSPGRSAAPRRCADYACCLI
jgi:hypothetical protein